MPAEVSTSRLFAFLKGLRDTGNATLAAEWAGVSRDWAYKRRRHDPWFEALYREMKAVARERLGQPPLPAQSAAESPSPAKGRGAVPEAPSSGGEGLRRLTWWCR